MRRRLLCGNWKMHLDRAEAVSLARAVRDAVVFPADLDNLSCVLFPPYPYLEAVRTVVDGSPLKLGAQNLHEADRGAHTGEVSASMLVDVGCEMVIVGHSERRHGLGESDALVAAKVNRALEAGLTPVVCVGETGAERDAGQTWVVLERQVGALVPLDTRCIVAYEPVWAIGTGRVATPQEAETVHLFIREQLGCGAASVPILYGGSLNSDNASALFAQPNVDGGLVGGASLKADVFARMLVQLQKC